MKLSSRGYVWLDPKQDHSVSTPNLDVHHFCQGSHHQQLIWDFLGTSLVGVVYTDPGTSNRLWTPFGEVFLLLESEVRGDWRSALGIDLGGYTFEWGVVVEIVGPPSCEVCCRFRFRLWRSTESTVRAPNPPEREGIMDVEEFSAISRVSITNSVCRPESPNRLRRWCWRHSFFTSPFWFTRT